MIFFFPKFWWGCNAILLVVSFSSVKVNPPDYYSSLILKLKLNYLIDSNFFLFDILSLSDGNSGFL